VHLVHRRDALRSEKILQERLFKNEKINIIWNSEVDEIIGDDNPKNVTGIKLKSTIDKSLTDLKVDGVFIAIGHDPATQIFKGQINMDDGGYIITEPDSTLTNIDGVYAAGDVKDKTYRQAVTAAGMGCMAALEAEKYISSLE
jgi:thioredoxin reductase (NADPH)